MAHAFYCFFCCTDEPQKVSSTPSDLDCNEVILEISIYCTEFFLNACFMTIYGQKELTYIFENVCGLKVGEMNLPTIQKYF